MLFSFPCSDYSFVFIFCAMSVDLKKLKSEGAVVVHKYRYTYMFDEWVGFVEIDVDLLRFWWLWRKSKVSDCLIFIEL